MPEIRSVVNTRLNGKFDPKPKNTFTSSYLSCCSSIWAAGFWDMSCRDVSSFSSRFLYQIVFKNSSETKAVIELWCASGTRFCPTLHLSNKDNTTITASTQWWAVCTINGVKNENRKAAAARRIIHKCRETNRTGLVYEQNGWWGNEMQVRTSRLRRRLKSDLSELDVISISYHIIPNYSFIAL